MTLGWHRVAGNGRPAWGFTSVLPVQFIIADRHGVPILNS
jgi:hypothetical protein